jgi:hypothetical protein
MSLDRALREAFEHDARTIGDHADERLTGVMQAGRRRRRTRRAAVAVGVAAICALGVLSVPVVSDLLAERDAVPAGPPGPFAEIAGVYEVTLPASEGGEPFPRVAGVWVMSLGDQGIVVLSSPPGTRLNLSGVSFSIEGDRFRINAFANGPCGQTAAGTYRWRLTDDELILTPLDEPCAVRAAVFGARPWRVV